MDLGEVIDIVAARHRRVIRRVLHDLEARGLGHTTEARMCRAYLRRSGAIYRYLRLARTDGEGA